VALTYKISQSWFDAYSAGPSEAKTRQVKNLQENVRSALAQAAGSRYDTFLQGSYRNSTAIAEINDVDIVALYDPWSSPASHVDWTSLFNHVAEILSKTSLLNGDIHLGDKCVKFEGALKADIVPSISRSTYSSTDPVIIYSRGGREERPNYPRTHYSNGVKKQSETGDNYKSTVRLFKRWARQYESLRAPSYYIECAVHSVPEGEFDSYLPLSFISVGAALLHYTSATVIKSVAGDKDILLSSEWDYADFKHFQSLLTKDISRVLDAMRATSTAAADAKWKLAFGD